MSQIRKNGFFLNCGLKQTSPLKNRRILKNNHKRLSGWQEKILGRFAGFDEGDAADPDVVPHPQKRKMQRSAPPLHGRMIQQSPLRTLLMHSSRLGEMELRGTFSWPCLQLTPDLPSI